MATETEQHPVLAGLRVEEVRSSLSAAELGEGMRALLVTFSSIFGELTAEILTPALHAELDKVDIEQIVRASVRAAEDIAGESS